MKKLTRTLALAVIASLFSFASIAAEPTKPSEKKSFEVGMYRVVNTMNMKILVEKTAGSSVEIRLKNKNHETVYTEMTNKKSTSINKKFNLEGLEDGKYTFEISNGKETIVKEFELSTTKPMPADYRSIELK